MPPGSDWRQGLRDAGPYLTLGVQLAFTLLAFTIGGYFLDRWIGSLPWFTIGGALLGLVSLFAQLFRIAGEAGRASERPRE